MVKMLSENKDFEVKKIVDKDEFFGKIKDKDEFYYQLDMSRFENPRALREGSKVKNIDRTIKTVSASSS